MTKNTTEFKTACRERKEEVLFALYDRIPLLDIDREDLGYGHLTDVLFRDALATEGMLAKMGFFLLDKGPLERGNTRNADGREIYWRGSYLDSRNHSGVQLLARYLGAHRNYPIWFIDDMFDRANASARFKTIVREFLIQESNEMTDARGESFRYAYMYGPDTEAIYGYELAYSNLRFPLAPITSHPKSSLDFHLQIWRKKILHIQHGDACQDLKPESAEKILLAMLSHPTGQIAAFNVFELFCELIPAERMYDILFDTIEPSGVVHPALVNFTKRFLPLKDTPRAIMDGGNVFFTYTSDRYTKPGKETRAAIAALYRDANRKILEGKLEEE